MKIKVLHVIHSLNGGGAETQSQLLAVGLAELGVDSFFFCVKPEGHMLGGEENIFRCSRSSKYDLGIYKQLNNVIKDIQPDVIHAWLPAVVTIPAMLLGWLYAIPVVFSYRNKMFFHRPISYPEFAAALLFCNKIISNNFIGQSDKAFRWLYKKKKGETIYNAVALSQRKTVFALNNKTMFRLIFAGRLTKQKNIGFMLDALKEINYRNDWYLDIYGVGELESNLKAQAQALGLDSKVNFRGFCQNIGAEMCEADLLLFPSAYEGMSNILVEALSVGLPVIASDIVASRDVIKEVDCVSWFALGDREGLLRSVTAFLDSPESSLARIEEGLRITADLTVTAMAEKYNEQYRSLL